MRRGRVGILVVFALTLVIGAVGCGSGSGNGSTGGATGTVADSQDGTSSADVKKIKVGIQPVVEAAPLYLGMREGFFEEEGLEIEPMINTGGGAPITAQVVAGEAQIGFSNPTSLVLARDNGLDVKIIAPASEAGNDENDAATWIVVSKDGDIKTPKDLEGKKLAVNALANMLETTAREALSKEGVDVSKIDFVEVPFPDMPAALDTGRVDAFFSVEPFVTQSLANKGKRLINPYERVLPGLSTADYFATADYIGDNPEIIEGFRRAIAKSTKYANANLDQVREIVPTYTKLTPEIVEEMRFAVLAEEIDPAKYEPHVRLAKQFGLTKNDPQVEDLIAR